MMFKLEGSLISCNLVIKALCQTESKVSFRSNSMSCEVRSLFFSMIICSVTR